MQLVPPVHAKPFVKRQKRDAAAPEAICEVTMCPSMRSVPVKSEETKRGRDFVPEPRAFELKAQTAAAGNSTQTYFVRLPPDRCGNNSKQINAHTNKGFPDASCQMKHNLGRRLRQPLRRRWLGIPTGRTCRERRLKRPALLLH